MARVNGAIFLAALTVIVRSSPACHDAAELQDGRNKTDYMAFFKPLLARTLHEAVDSNADVRAWYVTKSKVCQEFCLMYVYDQSVGNLWSVGQLFNEQKTHSLLTDAFVGGMNACYPQELASDTSIIVQKLVGAMMASKSQHATAKRVEGYVSSSEDLLLHSRETCKSESFAGAAKPWVDEFVARFPKAMKDVISTSRYAKTYFSTIAGDCQKTCVQNTLRQTVQTFWDTEMIQDGDHRGAWAHDAITGALQSCYPDVPQRVLHGLVGELFTRLPYPQLGSTTREGFMRKFEPLISSSMTEALATNVNFNTWFAVQTYDCQQSCLHDVLVESAKTMWDTGDLFDEQRKQEWLTGAFTGAFHACYPIASPEENDILITKLVDHLSKGNAETKGAMAAVQERRLRMCTHSSSGSEGNALTEGFIEKVSAIIDAAKLKNREFSHMAQDSEHTCASNALRWAFENLQDTGLAKSEEQLFRVVAQKAVTGALEACYVRGFSLPAVARPLQKMNQEIQQIQASMLMPHPTLPPTPPPTLPQCKAATEQQLGKTKQEYLDGLNPLVLKKLISITDSPEHITLKEWLRQHTWDCQKSCLHHVFDQAVGTLWGTGELFDTPKNQDLLSEALAGGFKACYPRMSRPQAHLLMSEVVQSVLGMRRLRGNTGELAEGARKLAFSNCNFWSTTETGKNWLDSLVVQFTTYLDSVTPKLTIFDTARDCQRTCARHTLRKAMETFWNTGMITDRSKRKGWAQDALTGALKTCYPSLPRADVYNIVGAMMGNMTLVDHLPAPAPPASLYETSWNEDSPVNTEERTSDLAPSIVIPVAVAGLLAAVAVNRWLPFQRCLQRRPFSGLSDAPANDGVFVE